MKNGILEDNVNYEKHKYSDEPINDLSIWTHAYQWYSEKQHKIIRDLDKYLFKKNSEFHKQDIKDYIDKVSQNEWESFSDLFEKINEIREILFDDTLCF
jgi:hypothetical protein